MECNYKKARNKGRTYVAMLIAWLLFGSTTLNAQVSAYVFTQVSGTYTPLSSGTSLGTTSSDDQRFVDPGTPAGGTTTTGVGFPIGFNFTYNGDVFDRIAINANGWISFGKSSLTPAVDMYSSDYYNVLSSTYATSDASQRNRIAAVSRDLSSQAGGGIKVSTIGTTPNQVCVIEWTNYKRYGSTGTGDALNFQIRLYETTNVAEVQFGSMTFGTGTSTGTSAPQSGLGGLDETDWNSRTTTTDWNTSTGASANNQGLDVNTGVTYPVSGTTFRWTPSTCGAPNTVSTANVTTNSVDITWSAPSVGTPQNYVWVVVPAGNSPDNGIVASGSVTGVTTTASATGLNPSSNYDVYVRSICGSGDTSNYSTVASFTTNCSAFSTPWIDGLESTVTQTGESTVAPTCWAFQTISGSSWYTDDAVLRNSVGAHSGNKFLYCYYGSESWAFTPGINLTAGTSYRFSCWYNNTDVTSPGLHVSINYGTGQLSDSMTTTLGVLNNTTNTTYQRFMVDFTPATTGVYYFGLHDSTPSYTPWYLTFDDFIVQETPQCPEPINLTANVASTSATISWQSSGPGAVSSLEYGPSGFTPGTGTVINGVTSPYNLTGLTAQTQYDVYVTDTCTGNTPSLQVGPTSFTTGCTPFTVPWVDSFETSVVNTGESTIAPDCWSTFTISGSDWTSDDAPVRNSVGAHSGTKYEFTQWSTNAWLFTPGIQLTGGVAYEYSFWYANTDVTSPGLSIQTSYGTSPDTAGMTTVLGTLNNTTNTSYVQFKTYFTPSTSGVYYFGVHNNTTSSTPWYMTFDDFVVQGAPNCPPPVNVAVAATDTTATVTWTSTGSGASSTIEYGPAGFTPGTGTVVSGLTSPYTISGLAATTSYDVYVFDSCSGNTTSDTAGPVSFSTFCTPFPTPGDFANTAIVVNSYPYTDTVNTNDPCYTDDPNGQRGGKDVYWKFTTDPCATSVTISLCGSGFDTYLYIMDSTNTTQVDYNDDFCSSASQVTLSAGGTLTPGATYYALVEPYSSGDVGEIDMSITQVIGGGTVDLTTNEADASCPSSTDGSASVTVNNFADLRQPLTYTWTNGSTDSAQVNIAPGNYTVTVTDACGSSATASVTVGSSFSVTYAVTDVTCNAGNDGAINVTSTGGTTPYTYAWSGGATTEDLSGLTAGTYNLTVTDSTGCSGTFAIAVNEPSPITISATVSNVTCFGQNNGAIDITATGGNPSSFNQTVTVSGGSLQTNSTITFSGTPPIAGNGTVVFSAIGDLDGSAGQSNLETWTFYDENNNQLAVIGGSGISSDQCSATPLTTTVTLSQAQLAAWAANGSITFTATATSNVNLTLCGNDYIAANLSYGVAGYTYSWSNGSTAEDLIALGAGSYTVTATDQRGCSGTNTFTVNNVSSSPIVPQLDSIVNVKCNGDSTGGVYVTITGGAPPYSYLWSNGSTDSVLTGVPAGTYTGTVTDNVGCAYESPAIPITQPAALTPALDSLVNVKCNGQSNGGVYVTISGGTPPYSYLWSNGATTPDLTGVGPGTYMGTVTDANGCILTSPPISITQPDSLSAALDSLVNVRCFGASTGGVYVTISGGTTPYSYSWSNGTSAPNLTGVPAGIYTGTVTDANGCQLVSPSIPIGQPADSITPTLDSMITVRCYGDSNGAVYITITGGTSPYTYAWSNGSTASDLVGVPAGTYAGTVTDANGCQLVSPPIPVTQPAQTVITDSVNNVKCFSESTGSIYTTVSGGAVSPYTYAWSNGANGANLTGVPGGTYTLTLTDAHGCHASLTDSVHTPAAGISGGQVITTDQIQGGAFGTATVNPTGGTPGYTFLWSNGDTSQTITNLVAGTYTVTITDHNGCTDHRSGTVSFINGIPNVDGALNISVYPNPTKDQVFVDVKLTNTDNVTLQVYNVEGQLIAELNKKDIASTQFTLDFSTQAAGVYMAKIKVGDSTVVKRIVVAR